MIKYVLYDSSYDTSLLENNWEAILESYLPWKRQFG